MSADASFNKAIRNLEEDFEHLIIVLQDYHVQNWLILVVLAIVVVGNILGSHIYIDVWNQHEQSQQLQI